MDLEGKNILITGAALRVGRALALAAARRGAGIVIHHRSSDEEARSLKNEIEAMGGQAHLLAADLADPEQAAWVVERAWAWGDLFGLVNNASIFEPLTWDETTVDAWNRTLMINLTAPFLLSQVFARKLGSERPGRIINLLDWRALRPGKDHLPYTISKAGLAALTRSLAVALAPNITVNGIALGAVLPPGDGGDVQRIIQTVPAGRWAELEEVEETFLFLLAGPMYVTGEIIHVDGGRHLV